MKNSIKSLLKKTLSNIELYRYEKKQSSLMKDYSFTEASNAFKRRNDLHAYMHHYFRHLAPEPVREHRNYFNQDMRGFGEDALHAMWWTLLTEFKPTLALEIGVYRGQVVSLWGLIAKLSGFECEVHGVSPFSPAGDQVSTYLSSLDYLQETFESSRRFGLSDPHLFKGYSTDVTAVEYIKSRKWNLIYVDGNHDYEVALSDYILSRDSLQEGGVLIMDDSSLNTEFSPPSFSFAGHPGPSRVVQERAMKEMQFLGGVGHNNVFKKV